MTQPYPAVDSSVNQHCSSDPPPHVDAVAPLPQREESGQSCFVLRGGTEGVTCPL